MSPKVRYELRIVNISVHEFKPCRNVTVTLPSPALGTPQDRPSQPPAAFVLQRRDALAAMLAAPFLALAAPSTPCRAASGARQLTPAERMAIEAAFASTLPKAKAPVALRLVFHDAATYDVAGGNGGMNASIQYELDRPENFGLKRGLGVVEQTVAKLKGTAAEGAVSKADLIALAGAHAVRITGGPVIDVPVGRIDASGADPEGRLPAETLSAVEQLQLFGAKGISAEEMIALLGSHTVSNRRFRESSLGYMLD